MQHEILDKIAALPGVASAGFASHAADGQGGPDNAADRGRRPDAGARDTPPARRSKFVSPGYFEAMGTRLIAGRDITWSDIEAGGRVAVISEDFARELAAEPAGALRQAHPDRSSTTDAWREVIGVVQSVHEDALYEEPPSFVYWPRAHGGHVRRSPCRNAGRRVRDPQRARGHGEPHGGDPAGRLVREREHPVAQERTMQDLYAGSLARTSFTLVMLAIAGGMALAARRHRDLRRHRLRRVAANSGNRYSLGARRRADGSSRGCSCCTGSR